MNLRTEDRPATVTHLGSDGFIAAAGQHVRIETSPGGIEHLDAVVPVGKTWQVTINVHIQEI